MNERLTRRRLLTGFAAMGTSMMLGVPALATWGNDTRQSNPDSSPAQNQPWTIAEPTVDHSYEWETIAHPSETSFLDQQLIPGATYEYRICSVAPEQQSDWSASVPVTTIGDPS